MTAVQELVRAEREAFLAFLETLAPAQWATPSLCSGWDVQAVAAHVAWASALSPLALVRELLRAGGRPNRLMADTAVRWSSRGTAAVLAQLRRDLDTDARPLGMPWDAVLVDAVVHGLDVRRPLRAPRTFAPETFRRVADFAAGARWPTAMLLGGAARRVVGVRLVTAGQDWSTGAGPEVTVSPDATLLLLTGRPVDPTELSGPGSPIVAARLRSGA